MSDGANLGSLLCVVLQPGSSPVGRLPTPPNPISAFPKTETSAPHYDFVILSTKYRKTIIGAVTIGEPTTLANMATSTSDSCRPLRIAIVGAGITGLHLLLGLLARLSREQADITLYERYAVFHSAVGAGFGLSANAERAMELLSPDILKAYKRAANPNGEDYFRWEDGFGDKGVLCKLYLGPDGFQGCRRADFLEQLVAVLGEENIRERVRLGREVVGLEQTEGGEVKLGFKDGTEEVADVGELRP